MNGAQERALRELSRVLDWSATSEHAWNPPPFHVAGLHPRAERLIGDGIGEAAAASGASPLGVVIEGQGGAGKTHLLGWVKGRIAEEGGYFFLADFSSGSDFWRVVARAMVQDLGRSTSEGLPVQAVVAVLRLAELAGVADRFAADRTCTRADLDALEGGLIAYSRRLLGSRDTIRALALYAVGTPDGLQVGNDHLTSVGETRDGDRAAWGLTPGLKGHQEIVSELSALLALTGPAAIAVDQIDALLEHSRRSRASGASDGENRSDAIEEIAGGLMALRHVTQRTLCLMACLPSSWRLIEEQAVGTARDRFRTSLILSTLADPAAARAMIERRFSAAFSRAGFDAPDPVWPISPDAFATSVGLTPRTVLRHIGDHIERCRNEGAVRILAGFDETPAEPAVPACPDQFDLARLDARFAELRDAAQIDDAFDPEHEDEIVPALLRAGLNAWIMEQGQAGRVFRTDPPPSGKLPEVHARLRQTLDANTEEERHWTFRMIGASHGNKSLARLRAGMRASGLGADVPDRSFIVLRNPGWSDGEATRATLADLKEWGGFSVPIRGDDLRVYAALSSLIEEADPGLEAWLLARRPAGATDLLSGILADVIPTAAFPSATAQAAVVPTVTVLPEAPGPAAGEDALLTIGHRLDNQAQVTLDPAVLAQHVGVFAGSGSGKTVLLRRIIEECALLGVSSIVLDPNNDLARLGEPWPEPPEGWLPGDAERAGRYVAEVEVVIWTPGRSAGRPLTFQPLPDFAALQNAPDELESALSLAVETLASRARLTGATAKADKGRAVLREALAHFARTGGSTFPAFLEMLSALPFAACALDKADEIAAEIGQVLKASTITDPLFAGAGEPVDPASLLTPSPGKRARVSVISLAGLTDESRPNFVSQLQATLFTWIKRNPPRDSPLRGLFVMDEAQIFAPSGKRTPSLAATQTLISQARKYGLALIFATQAPKGVDNKVTGNATTVFIGRINNATQLAVVKEMARARGGNADRAGRLNPGEFYASSLALSSTLLQTPQCLTHHPQNPLTEEEILHRAQEGRDEPGN
ncbi:ATP-binding protein [Spirillospora sp. CA-253888]